MIFDVPRQLMKWCSAHVVAFGLMAMLCGCGASGPPPPWSAQVLEDVSTPEPAPRPPSISAAEQAFNARARAALQRVANARKLAILSPVKAQQIDRARAAQLLKENLDRNIKPSALVAQGELLRSFGLIPAEFDFVAGLMEFASGELAGLYDPDRKTMFVMEGMSGLGAEHAVLHELAHALHDQHFGLGDRLRLKPDGAPPRGDRVAAEHCLMEGDATAVAFLAQTNTIPSSTLYRQDFERGLAGREDIPAVMRQSLVVPYVDGLAFVEQLLAAGGWAAVDAAWRRPPRSTEQLLHLDKYQQDEAPLAVAAVMPDVSGWTLLDGDILGEQGLRLMLQQWGSDEEAMQAAAGWGGDRYLVLQQDAADGSKQFWASYVVQFDSEADAREAHALVKRAHPAACQQRPTVGPLAHARHGSLVALVAGPYQRKAPKTRAISGQDCNDASTWLQLTLSRAISK